MYGWCLADLKRYDEGVAQNAESLRLDPISAELIYVLGQTDYTPTATTTPFGRSGRPSSSFPAQALSRLPEMCWDGATPRRVNSTTQFKPSNKLAKRTRISRRRPPHSAGLLRSRETAKPHKKCSRNSMPVPKRHSGRKPYFYAMIYAGLGDKDQAFAELDKAYEARSWYLAVVGVDSKLDGLRSEPSICKAFGRGRPPSLNLTSR